MKAWPTIPLDANPHEKWSLVAIKDVQRAGKCDGCKNVVRVYLSLLFCEYIRIHANLSRSNAFKASSNVFLNELTQNEITLNSLKLAWQRGASKMNMDPRHA